jgi:hypothetical protein
MAWFRKFPTPAGANAGSSEQIILLKRYSGRSMQTLFASAARSWYGCHQSAARRLQLLTKRSQIWMSNNERLTLTAKLTHVGSFALR